MAEGSIMENGKVRSSGRRGVFAHLLKPRRTSREARPGLRGRAIAHERQTVLTKV